MGHNIKAIEKKMAGVRVLASLPIHPGLELEPVGIGHLIRRDDIDLLYVSTQLLWWQAVAGIIEV